MAVTEQDEEMAAEIVAACEIECGCDECKFAQGHAPTYSPVLLGREITKLVGLLRDLRDGLDKAVAVYAGTGLPANPDDQPQPRDDPEGTLVIKMTDTLRRLTVERITKVLEGDDGDSPAKD